MPRRAAVLVVALLKEGDQPDQAQTHRRQHDRHDEEASHRRRAAPLRARSDPQREQRTAGPEIDRGEANQRKQNHSHWSPPAHRIQSVFKYIMNLTVKSKRRTRAEKQAETRRRLLEA